jgi:hypothetical protein
MPDDIYFGGREQPFEPFLEVGAGALPGRPEAARALSLRNRE